MSHVTGRAFFPNFTREVIFLIFKELVYVIQNI